MYPFICLINIYRIIIDSLRGNAPDTAQAWFAGDVSTCGLLEKLWIWWEHLNRIGPSGYFPKPSKTFIVVKNPELIEKAKELFGKDVKITADGHRHIGAALGSEAFKLNFITKKVEKWVQDVQDLAKIAKEEPQAALSAFNVGMSQRWTFVQRTDQGISALFQPLEDAIRDQLIPTLCGKHVSDIERRMLTLPYRYGGLGIRNPVGTADAEYEASVKVSKSLSDMIVQQERIKNQESNIFLH